MLTVPRQSQRFEKGCSEFGRHDVVEDWIDGRVNVDHDATEVECREPCFRVICKVLVGSQNKPQRQHSERHQTDEEEHHHCAQLQFKSIFIFSRCSLQYHCSLVIILVIDCQL